MYLSESAILQSKFTPRAVRANKCALGGQTQIVCGEGVWAAAAVQSPLHFLGRSLHFLPSEEKQQKKSSKLKQQKFGYEDHRAIYNYAQERGPHHQPPIRTIDASVAPPEVTLYQEYPHLEFSSPLALTFTA